MLQCLKQEERALPKMGKQGQHWMQVLLLWPSIYVIHLQLSQAASLRRGVRLMQHEQCNAFLLQNLCHASYVHTLSPEGSKNSDWILGF